MEAVEIHYSLFLACAILMMCSYYLGNFAVTFFRIDLREDAKTAIHFISAPLAILACLLMSGLVMASRTNLHEREDSLEKFAVNAIMLARTTSYDYGHRSDGIRDALLEYVDHLDKDRPLALVGSPKANYSRPLLEAVRELPVLPLDPLSSEKKMNAIKLAEAVNAHRMELAVKQRSPVRSGTVLLVCLWFAALFASLGITSPYGDRMVIGYGLVAALCVSSAILLLAEYSNPTSGWIQLSSQPLASVRVALDELR